MKIFFKLFISLLLLANNMSAQGIEFSGYFENQFFPQKAKNTTLLQDYNKLRIDFNSDISDNITLNGDYVFQTFHGTTRYNLIDFLPQKYSSLLINSDNSMFDVTMRDHQFLDNAYLTLYSGDLTVRIGKQQLAVGSGYSWNPTDVFHAKNLLDPTYEKEGVNAFKLEYNFSNEGVVTAILSVDEDWTRSIKSIRVKEHLANFDIAIMLAEKAQNTLSLFPDLNIYEKRRIVGLDLSGELLGLGFWFEGAYNTMEKADNYSQLLFGTNYTFETGLFLQAEYYYNGLGNADGNYGLSDWLRMLGTEGENLGESYLVLGEQYTLFEFLDWSNFVILNLSDNSSVFYPYFDYTLNNNTLLTAIGYFPFGKKNSEFGEFGVGGILRARVYF